MAITDEQKQQIHNETGAGHALICLVEAAATAPLLEQIAALTAQLEEAKQDAADADSMSKALADLDTKNHRRWTFLHTNNKDAQGFEWCVMRVKWENGRISEALHTYSDMSDLDAAIAALTTP